MVTLLLQVPPRESSLKVVVPPAQILVGPMMAPGVANEAIERKIDRKVRIRYFMFFVLSLWPVC